MSIFKLSGIHLAHRKNTADMPPVRMGVPSEIVLLTSMHIGAPAVPVVKVGDKVCVGQLVAECGRGLSSPIYSGVSGTVKKIEEIVTSAGVATTAVRIASDGEQTVCEDIAPPVINSREDLIAAVARSGIVGLGGAGFPTSVKLSADVSKIDTIVVNGAECEPYITSDTRTMLDDADAVAEGLRILMKYLEVSRAVIGIEKNKPQCVRSMREACASVEGVEVKALPSRYPQGGEKVLVYHTVGRVIEEGKLPLDAGVIVINCTTVAAIAHYISTGMPLIEKCVTVDGSAVASPKNVIAPIGTPISELIEFCGGFKATPKKILSGGPMMGVAMSDLSMPVLKQTNAVLAFDEKDAAAKPATDCIRCGRCISTCPLGLTPTAISAAYDAKNGAELEALKVNLCMECGCCSYVCPAKRNIVQKNKLAKVMLREYQTSKRGEKK